MELGLTDRTVLITGASQGIGETTAWAFAREGCHLHLAARSAANLDRIKREIESAHCVDVHTHALDLSKRENLKKLADEAGDVDILVNNAGNIPGGSLESVDEETWEKSWHLKVYGYINLTRHIYKKMCERGAGVIVNDIGNAGERYDADYIAGCSGNASLMAFTRALGGRSLDYGVRVVGVNPGPVDTDRIVRLMKTRARDWYDDEDRYWELMARFPLGRPAKTEEVADLMLFLASDRAAYISGTVVTIDGGITSRNSIV